MPPHQRPTCESDSEQEQGDATSPTTAAPEACVPIKTSKTSKTKRNSVPGSDSGYSSLSKTSKASSSTKASSGRTPRPYHSANVSHAKTDVTKDTAPPSSSKSSKQPSRSQSKVRTSSSSSCPHPNCEQCKMARRHNAPPPVALNTQGQWAPSSVPPSPHLMVSPAAPYQYSTYAAHPPVMTPPVMAPPAAHNGPPPAAVPRQRRPSSVSYPRPVSIAAPGGAYAYQAPPPNQQRPPSIPTHSSPAAVPTLPPPPPRPAPTPVAAQGTWVRVNNSRLPTTHPAPPPSRPALTRGPTDATVTTNRRISIAGEAPMFHYGSTPPTAAGHYEPVRTEMPPPALPPAYPTRSSSRRPSQESHSRRQSVSYEQDGYFVADPHRTIRPNRESLRPSLLGQAVAQSKPRSATYYRETPSHYPRGAILVERATPPYGHERMSHRVQQARDYQDAVDDQHYDDDDFADTMRRMRIEPPPSPQLRRPSQSRHNRSSSQAGSSISRMSTETGTMRLIMEGNSLEISGDTEGRAITMTAGEDGKPQVIVGGGPGSPTKSREKRYVPDGSTRSKASFSERHEMRTPASGMAAESPSGVSGNIGRRRSVVASKRQSRDYY